MNTRRYRNHCCCAALAALLALTCGDDPAGPGPGAPSGQAWAADTLIVRGLLDVNGQWNTPVSNVAGGERGRISYVNLSGRGIAALSNSIARLDSLTELYLHDNRLVQLPDSIVRLTRLTTLTVGRNRLCDISAQLRAWLTLYATVPGWDTTQECVTLADDTLAVRAILDSNGLMAVAVFEVVDTAGERVVSLFLARRAIFVLPASIGELHHLRILDVHGNSLSALPASLLLLDSLRIVLIDDNRLCDLDTAVAQWADQLAAPWRQYQDCGAAVDENWGVLLLDQDGLKADTVWEHAAGWLAMGSGDDSLCIDSMRILAAADTAMPPLLLSFRPVGVAAYGAGGAVLCTVQAAGPVYGGAGASPLMVLGERAAAYLVDFRLQPCHACSAWLAVPPVRIGDSLVADLQLHFRRWRADSMAAFVDTLRIIGRVDGVSFAQLRPQASGLLEFTTATWNSERVHFSALDSCKAFSEMLQHTPHDLYVVSDTLAATVGIKRLGTLAYRQSYWYCNELALARGVLDTIGYAVSQAGFSSRAPLQAGGLYLLARADSTQVLLAAIGLMPGASDRIHFVWGIYDTRGGH